MNLVLANDNLTARDLEHLAPHKNSLNMNKLKGVSDVASIPKPVASTIAHWLCSPRQISNDPAKQAFLEELAEPA